MSAPERYIVRVRGSPVVSVTNVHVGDYFVYNGSTYDKNLERDFEVCYNVDDRKCTENTILKLITMHEMEFAPRPAGARCANIRLKHPRMQYVFEAQVNEEAQVNKEETMHEEATEESEAQIKKAALCTVDVYDLKYMINNYKLCKMPGASYQIASVGRKQNKKTINKAPNKSDN